jgi:hypothetical protein
MAMASIPNLLLDTPGGIICNETIRTPSGTANTAGDIFGNRGSPGEQGT